MPAKTSPFSTLFSSGKIPLAARERDFEAALRRLGIPIQNGPMLTDIVCGLMEAIDARTSQTGNRSDYGEIAQQSAAEALYAVIGRETRDLFGVDAVATKSAIAGFATVKQFAVLARDFFAELTRRHINYYLSRELSKHVGPGRQFIGVRQHRLFEDALDVHCREATRVIKEYSGEWLSKHNYEGGIDPAKAGRFVSYASKKIRRNYDTGEMPVSLLNLVVCGGLPLPPRAPAGSLELDTSSDAPGAKRVYLKLDPLTERLVDDLDPVMADAVEIASYVFTSDKLIQRGSPQMHRMGGDWRRRFRFIIPVRKREIWCQQEVYDTLVDALSFLSEDEFTFEFEERGHARALAPFLRFNEPDARTINPDDIILFSGGLDSVGGAVQQLIGQGRSAVLVTHKSSKNLANRQDAVVRSLIERTSKERIFYAPVWVGKGDYDAIEYTQRTRSFLFVSLGMAIARSFGRDTIHFFENGITSFNLPIAEHVIGTRASRTTHPRTLASFARLFSLLLQRTLDVKNQFLWRTKSEVVEMLRQMGARR